ncbi:MAG: hypothetical protein KQH79_09910 [Bacteroidetes bacterium]|nr:hypothetical protein [Bacteroidota bacterium]
MKNIIAILFCITALSGYAQKIENLKIDQNGGEILLQYDLTGNKTDIFEVSVFYSDNNTDWKRLDKVYGDVGDSLKAGKTKQVVLWTDHLENVQNNMYFKVQAQYYSIEEQQKGTLTDKNNVQYNWIRVGKNKWMTENLKSTTSDEDCGGYFTNVDARNVCPDGWHLPNDEEWMELEVEFGMASEEAKTHGLREINLNQIKNAGFAIQECNYDVSLYPNQKALAFWTSTENKMLYTGYSQKYFARIIRIGENKISKELREKTEKLNVRCVQSSVYLATIEAIAKTAIDLNPTGGITNHPYTGEQLEWKYIGGAIWMQDDLLGSYQYKELDEKCPTGWRLPEEDEWKKLFEEYKPSIELENSSEILSERLSSDGIWGFNLSNNDYWMNVHRYTYNTYWINENDKEDSKKLVAFPTNNKGQAGWVRKQTNEKAKVRCLLDNEDYITKKDQIKNGTFIDKRDNQEYGFVEIDGTTWMAENLNYSIPENSMCRNNIKKDCELFGHMYNIEVAENACPDGWRLPSKDEWKYLLINKAANNLKILYPFGGTGFDLLLGGELIYDEENKMDVFTANYLLMNEDKPGYYYIDSKGKVELNDKAKRRDYYYIRCVKK